MLISAGMAFEIERKFLVKGDAWRGLAKPVRIRQGYVATTNNLAENPYVEWRERKETK